MTRRNNALPKKYRSVPHENGNMSSYQCGICGSYVTYLKIEASTTGNSWWWEDSACSEACLNIWLLNRI